MKLTWDATGKHYYENGVDHGVLYPQKSDGTYDDGVAWDGLTGVTESPDGAEPNDLYADNIKYATLRSAETFGGTIEAYQYPPVFAACDGSVSLVDGVYIGQQPRVPFGFSYRTYIGSDTMASGTHYKLHIVYNATVTPSERNYETVNDSPDAITMSWDFDTVPVNVTDQKPTSTIVIDSREANATKLAALEDLLYGTNNTDPSLPTPDEIVALFQ